MQRFAVVAVVLGGCLSNPTVEVDHTSLDIARGTASEVLVSLDGAPVSDLDELLWSVENDALVSVTRSYDGVHLRIGGDNEGETVVHVNSHGQDLPISVRVGPPAIVLLWTEPSRVDVVRGGEVQVRAKILDTLSRVVDITFDSRWNVRDRSIVSLDQAGMMLHAVEAGETTLHVSHDGSSALVPVAVFK